MGVLKQGGGQYELGGGSEGFGKFESREREGVIKEVYPASIF